MTDTGFCLVFLRKLDKLKFTAMVFLDMDWIDNFYQSTSDTKLIAQEKVDNGAFALIYIYGYYHIYRK